MSEEGLRRFMERINSDDEFRQRVADHPQGSVGGFDLSPTELAALAANDDDGLRRLLAEESTGFTYERGPTPYRATLLCGLGGMHVPTYPKHWSGGSAIPEGACSAGPC